MNNDSLADFFKTDFPHNEEGLGEFLGAFETKSFKKNALLLKAGQRENQLRFLSEGVVREYFTKEAKQTNIGFITTPQFITHISSFNNNTPTMKHQEAITDIKLKVLGKQAFTSFLEKYTCGKSIIEITIGRLLEKKEQAEYRRVTKKPEELYQDILTYHPDWLQKVPQYHIASYLGITPETLSRIRARLS